MNVWRAETAEGVGCSQEHSRYEVIVRMRYLRDPFVTGTQGDCRGGYKTILTKAEPYYSPAEEDIRLRHIFRPLQGYTNLTNQLLNRVSRLKALYSHTNTL